MFVVFLQVLFRVFFTNLTKLTSKMKKQISLLLFTILSFNIYSQVLFEKGYYINNVGQKIDCLIKNFDWKNNPTDIEYKLIENSDSKYENIKSIKEFGINNNVKYFRRILKIDKSIEDIDNLSFDRKPIFVE